MTECQDGGALHGVAQHMTQHQEAGALHDAKRHTSLSVRTKAPCTVRHMTECQSEGALHGAAASWCTQTLRVLCTCAWEPGHLSQLSCPAEPVQVHAGREA